MLLALVAGSAGLGNLIGVVTASLVKQIRPAVTVSVVMVADTAAVLVAALFYSVPVLVLLGW